MMIELDLVAYPRRVVDEVKSNVDAITTFPLRTEKPNIREMATGRRWSMSRCRVTAGHRAGAGRSHHDSRDHAGGHREGAQAPGGRHRTSGRWRSSCSRRSSASTAASSSASCGVTRPARSPKPSTGNFTMSIMHPGSEGDVQPAGPDLDRPRAAADEVKQQLREYAGVHEVTDTFRAGKEEEKLGISRPPSAASRCRASAGRCGRRSAARRRNPSSAAATTSASRSATRATSAARSATSTTSASAPRRRRGALQPSRRRAGTRFASIHRVDRDRAVNVPPRSSRP